MSAFTCWSGVEREAVQVSDSAPESEDFSTLVMGEHP